ncbi:MAG: hypothetical protein HGJ97_08315 [Desulfosporosinus sp.]|nr:hypothetical protein [Desulfosporosinus sp.]
MKLGPGSAHIFAVPAPLGHSHPAAAARVICPSRAAAARCAGICGPGSPREGSLPS